MATASLVLGIVATVLSLLSCIPYVNYCTCWMGPIVGVVGIVLGAVGRSSAGPSRQSMATWGLVLGIVSIIITIAVIVLYLLMFLGILFIPALADYASY
jgi:hypothetical protein